MVVKAEELMEIDEILSAPEASENGYAELRSKFPHLSWTRCDASDVFETPFKTVGSFDLHLIDTRDHCVQITPDTEIATGFILAKRGLEA